MSERKKFVVQQHERQNEPTHWDLMLEAGEALQTYRVPVGPEKWHSLTVETVRIFDHPLKFLSYEGPVNKGKGTVTIADTGTYRIIKQSESQLTVNFSGRFLKGEFRFTISPG